MDDCMTTIGSIAEVFDGPHATPIKTDVGPYFLSISSLENGRLDLSKSAHLSEEDFKIWTKRVTPRKGDLLFSYETRLGEAALMPDGIRACLGRRMGLLRPRSDKVISEYLLYAYLSPAFQQTIVANTITGATVDRLALNEFSDFPIRIPRLEEQKKVAGLLKNIDAKIELNQRINAELESMAKTLYDYWFVQFDFPNEKGKPYKSAGGKMVWSEKLGKKVPEGWRVEPLGKILKTNLGGTPSTKNPEYWENATIPWLNSGDLTEFPIIKSSSFVTRKGVDNSATTILPKGSVVISLVRYIRPSIIALEACANQSVVGIRETDQLKNAFIYPYLVNEVPRLMSLRTGAQQPHINKETIDDSPFCIPPANILKEYYRISEPIYKKIINVAFESQTLTELRDWLLPMLMNGQVRVSAL
jgi:type I restriction enzyme, S subunit